MLRAVRGPSTLRWGEGKEPTTWRVLVLRPRKGTGVPGDWDWHASPTGTAHSMERAFCPPGLRGTPVPSRGWTQGWWQEVSMG